MTTATIYPAPPWSDPARKRRVLRRRCVRALAIGTLGVGMLAAGLAVPSPKPAAARVVVVSVRSHLTGPFGLNTAVGLYTDCSAKTPLTKTEAAIDTCFTNLTYFVGHNPGVFAPVMMLNVGDVVTYTDASGRRHPLQVAALRDVPVDWSPTHDSGVVAQIQTCTSQGSWRIVDLGTATR